MSYGSISTSGECGSGPTKLQQLVRSGVGPVECAACSVGILPIQTLAKLQPTEWLLEGIAQLVCQIKHIGDEHICQAVAAEYGDLVVYLAANELLTPPITCGILGFCPKPDFPVYNVSFPTPKPPVQPYPTPTPDPNKNTLHLSDWIDRDTKAVLDYTQ